MMLVLSVSLSLAHEVQTYDSFVLRWNKQVRAPPAEDKTKPCSNRKQVKKYLVALIASK